MKPEELELLKRFFPEASVAMVGEIYSQRRFKLHFKRPRTSKLGDFRPPRAKNGICTITLNLDLNPYQMLITYVHEVAHYDVYQQFGFKNTQPHGPEWQNRFTVLLLPFMTETIFPKDVLDALQQHLRHIKASSTADLKLQRVLHQYDKNSETIVTVESLPAGTRFKMKNGLVFQKAEKQRTRYKCLCETNGRWYFVAALAEVQSLA
jgi:predicted SprT family Zn-dependent metalloprotease